MSANGYTGKPASETARRNSRGNQGSGKPPTGSEPVPFRGFINFSTTEADRPYFLSFMERSEHVGSLVPTLLEAGYKVSIRYEPKTGGFLVSVLDQDATRHSAGYVFTQRSGDWYKALCKALYVHFEVFKGVWPTTGGTSWTDPLE